jgi:hypothetical protein
MFKIALIAGLSAFAVQGIAHAQPAAPNLSGTYRCQPQPAPCTWQGPAPTISQSGSTVRLNINKDEFADGKLFSSTTLAAGPPFNAEGRIMPDHSIEWSNGPSGSNNRPIVSLPSVPSRTAKMEGEGRQPRPPPCFPNFVLSLASLPNCLVRNF